MPGLAWSRCLSANMAPSTVPSNTLCVLGASQGTGDGQKLGGGKGLRPAPTQALPEAGRSWGWAGPSLGSVAACPLCRPHTCAVCELTTATSWKQVSESEAGAAHYALPGVPRNREGHKQVYGLLPSSREWSVCVLMKTCSSAGTNPLIHATDTGHVLCPQHFCIPDLTDSHAIPQCVTLCDCGPVLPGGSS